MSIRIQVSRAVAIRRALLGATMLAGAFPLAAHAQDAAPSAAAATPAAQDQSADDQAIVVTGYRHSLAESIAAKRDATGFTDSIFAEDIGKFPDTNIAESFNRIPGVTISREIDGSGTNVAIRGLGSNFTNVTMNGAPIAVASSGTTDAPGTDRAVDLSFFPTDLFTQLTVKKSYSASLLEGGAAGSVDIRSARPFDHEGTHFTYNLQAIKNSPADKWGGRGSFLASTTIGSFGILAGVSAQRDQSRVTGFETIGWTNPTLSTPLSLAQARGRPNNTPTDQDIADAQCQAGNCNTAAVGGNGYTIPGVVPANAGNGLVTGDTINQAFLLAHNPGLTIQQIDNALIPRLGRPSVNSGTRDRINAILSAEWKPDETLDIYIDGMYGWKKNNLRRVDMNWVGRNGAAIPLNMTVDRDDCSAGCVATGGTFANSQFFLEYRPFIETTEYYGVNPGLSWTVMDKLKLNLQANYARSTFHRESPTVLVNTAPSSGVTVAYQNTGSIPTIETTDVDLNDPANFIWSGGRVNLQDERRRNTNKGVRGDLTWGDDHFNIKVGGNYDDISRRIAAYSNDQAWQNAVCGNNPSVFIPAPNSQPACNGVSAPGPIPATMWPGYGTGFTEGAVGRPTFGGSLIPQSALANYLLPSKDGFVTLDWNKFKKDSDYNTFHDNSPEVGSANTGASGGYIREKAAAAFIEANGEATVAGSQLRYNIGVRYVHTDQTIRGLISLSDARNADIPGKPAVPGTDTTPEIPGVDPIPGPLDGGKYPNVVSTATTHNSYDNWLPAVNLAYDVGEHAVARLALSKTMTRPDPSAQLPGVNFSSPSADTAGIGNPALKPYISKNIDFGIEYYTGPGGMVSIGAFRKELTGFTINGLTTMNFSDLAPYGITYDTLTQSQKDAIDSRGGKDVATITVQQQVNASSKLTVNGLEFQWVQPLDFLTEKFGVKGFGFNANATIVDQQGGGEHPPVALGVAKYTYNVTAYYENHGVTLRVAQTFQKGSQIGGLNQNGVTAAGLFSNDLRRWDFTSIFDIQKIFGIDHAPQITFDVVNFGNAVQRTYFQFDNAPYTEYKPGRQFMIGVRGNF